MRTVRIFVSSPTDVEIERHRVDDVVQRLNRAFTGTVRFETIRWETKFYSAHKSFYGEIPETTDCDLVIAIFWSRLGTPVSDDFPRMENDERYPSGSAYEVLTAIEARKKGERPDVYVFRKTTPPADPSEGAKAQWRDLNGFFARWFQLPDGRYLRAYHRFRAADEFEDQVEKLLRNWIAEHVPRDRSVIWPVETMGSPFRALLPFDAKHAPIYFGRDRKVTRAVEQLQNVARTPRAARSAPLNVPFLLIVGESGAGKSSLMRAGLVPRLTAAGVVPGVDVWRVAVARIGDDADPFLTLAKALLVSGKGDEEDGFGAALPELRNGEFATPKLLTDLLTRGAHSGKRKSAPAAVPIIKTLAQVQVDEKQRRGFNRRLRANLLLLVDQLENIFATHISDAQRSAFARLLFALCATRRVWTVATLRADLYAHIITPGDFLALKDAGGEYVLAAPGEAELTEIVHKSAAAAGLTYETDLQTGERLEERILKDAKGENTLPLLEFALDCLFKKRVLVDGEMRLTFDAYTAMGGLDGAIDQAAETAIARLGDEEQAALPRLLRSLAVPVDSKDSATRARSELTIRTVPIEEAIPDEPTRRLVDALIEARIIVTTKAGNKRDTHDRGLVGVSHQRVLESWRRAQEIVDEHKDFLRIRDDLEAPCHRWVAKGRSRGFLAKGVLLAEAQKIAKRYGGELSPDTHAFIAASSWEAQRFNILMGATAAMFAALFVVAAISWLKADRAEQHATANYGAAKHAVHELVSTITRALQNIQGIRIETVQSILGIVDSTIQTVQAVSLTDPEIERIRAEMFFQAGKTYQQKKDHPRATQAAMESLKLRSRLTNYDEAKTAPRAFNALPGEWRWELSQSLVLVGDIDREAKKFQDARARFQDALAIRVRLAEEAPDRSEWALGLSQLYVRIGDLERASNLALAQENYEKSLAISAAFFARDRMSEDWQRELSWSFNKSGDVNKLIGQAKSRDPTSKKAELAGALAAFSNSLCLRRRLAEQFPAKTEYTRDIAFTLDRIGATNVELDDAASAELAYFEALAVRRALTRSVSDNVLYLSDLAATLQQIGDFYRWTQDLELALAFYEASADERLQLKITAPHDNDVQANLDVIDGKVQAVRRLLADKGTLDASSEPAQRGRASKAENDVLKRQASLNRDKDACWTDVQTAVAQIVGPTVTSWIK